MFHKNEQSPLSRKKEKSTVIVSIVTSPSSKNFLPSSFPVNASTYIGNFISYLIYFLFWIWTTLTGEESRDSTTKIKLRREGKLLLWDHSLRYQNNLQQAFLHLHYPIPHEQRSAATDQRTVEIHYWPKNEIFWGGKDGWMSYN